MSLHRALVPRFHLLAGSLTEAHQPEGVGEGLAHAHAFFLVDVQGVGFDGQVMLQGGLGVDQWLQGVLRVPQALLQGLDGVVYLVHLVHKAAWGQKRRVRLAEVTVPRLDMCWIKSLQGYWIPTGREQLGWVHSEPPLAHRSSLCQNKRAEEAILGLPCGSRIRPAPLPFTKPRSQKANEAYFREAIKCSYTHTY